MKWCPRCVAPIGKGGRCIACGEQVMAKPIQKVAASVQAMVVVVCQNCGDTIEVKLEGWSNFGKEDNGDKTTKQ